MPPLSNTITPTIASKPNISSGELAPRTPSTTIRIVHKGRMKGYIRRAQHLLFNGVVEDKHCGEDERRKDIENSKGTSNKQHEDGNKETRESREKITDIDTDDKRSVTLTAVDRSIPKAVSIAEILKRLHDDGDHTTRLVQTTNLSTVCNDIEANAAIGEEGTDDSNAGGGDVDRRDKEGNRGQRKGTNAGSNGAKQKKRRPTAHGRTSTKTRSQFASKLTITLTLLRDTDVDMQAA